MKRREFIALLGGAVAWPVAAGAQQRMSRVGLYMNFSENDPEAQSRVAALRKGLEAAGWIEGRNLRLDYHWRADNSPQPQELAKELAELQPDVIVCVGSPLVAALKRATRTTPIVFASTVDPLGQGLVASLAKPGENVTGFANYEVSMAAKWLELLKEIAPNVSRVDVVFNPRTAPYFPLFMDAIGQAAPPLGTVARAAKVFDVSDLEQAVDELGRDPQAGLVVPIDTFTAVHRTRLIALAAAHRVPAIYYYRFYATEGGLISYGVDSLDLFHRAAVYVDRILKGAKPGNLPVQHPTKFELTINLKTAKALGLDVPPMLLARADEVIE